MKISKEALKNSRFLTVFLCFLPLQAKIALQEDGLDKMRFKKKTDLLLERMQPPVISTLYGKIAGKKTNINVKELSPVIEHLGIPYARPPVGKMRWKKPVDPRPWKGFFFFFLVIIERLNF